MRGEQAANGNPRKGQTVRRSIDLTKIESETTGHRCGKHYCLLAWPSCRTAEDEKLDQNRNEMLNVVDTYQLLSLDCESIGCILAPDQPLTVTCLKRLPPLSCPIFRARK